MSNHQKPILFIPGLFGCMSSEIVPRTGSWQFGFAKHMYLPFLELLKSKNLHMQRDLFILFYDWRKSVAYNVKTYLIPLLKKIETMTSSTSFHIVAHGTGGYLARYFIQNYPYSYHIKSLILIGTPHAGFASAFSYLTGGELQLSSDSSLNFINLYFRMHLYKTLPQRAALPNYLNQVFPALGEMIPSNSYGDYLFYEYNQKQHFVPYHSMMTTNNFLDRLNAPFNPYTSSTSVHLIAGEGYPTPEHFEIMPLCTDHLWVDGKVINSIDTLEGDGIHLIRSVFATEGIQHIVKSDYESLLIKAAPIYLPLILD